MSSVYGLDSKGLLAVVSLLTLPTHKIARNTKEDYTEEERNLFDV